MTGRWRCTGCGNVYAERPPVCTDCAGDSFRPVDGVDGDRSWRCTGCGIEYGTHPSACTDCGSNSFRPVERGATGSTRQAVPASRDRTGDASSTSSVAGTLGRNRWYVLGVVVAVAVGVALFTGVISPGTLAPDPCADVDGDAADSTTIDRQYVECTYHDRLNDYRTANGYADLRFDAGRHDVARELAETMARNGYTPEEAGREIDLGRRLQSCAPDGRTDWAVYQQVSYDTPVRTHDGSVTSYDTNAELVAGLRSNLHLDDTDRRIVLQGGYRTHAVGAYVTSDNEVYLVQLFC